MIRARNHKPKMTDAEFHILLADLRSGNQEAWRRAIDALRPILKDLAAEHLPERMAHRADASDVVQDALGRAVKSLAEFRGTSLSEFVAWLKEILRNDTYDAIRRHILAEVRSVNREATFERTNGSECGLEELLVADHSSPSQRCKRHEDQERLYRTIEQLPVRQQIAVRMKHLQGKPLAEIARVLGCNTGAAAALVARGIRSISSELA